MQVKGRSPEKARGKHGSSEGGTVASHIGASMQAKFAALGAKRRSTIATAPETATASMATVESKASNTNSWRTLFSTKEKDTKYKDSKKGA